MVSRRDFARLALAPVGAALLRANPKIDPVFNGVDLGVQSYSFRDRPLDAAIQAMVEIGLGDCELFAPHVEPRKSRDELRRWRLTVPLSVFQEVRRKFDNAGVHLAAYNYSFVDDFTDEEIDRGFEMTRALGLDLITASSTLTTAKRVLPFVEKHRMRVAFHGHSDTKDPNQFATPESFAKALAMSKRYAINLDIGHFCAAGYDPVAFIRANHEHIVILHLKDRKKNQGPNMPWGQGDTPIKPVLQLLKVNHYPIRAFIEYEYPGGDTITEVKKCLAYCKEALA